MLTIAEIGSNYRDFDDIIDYAFKLQADVIKLQYYSSMDLYGVDGRCKDVMFTVEEMTRLKDICRHLSKKLMISFFNHEDIDHFDDFTDFHKVASCEITYIPLLEEMARTGKDVFVSTAGATGDQIRRAVEIIGHEKIILMACNLEYPTTSSFPEYAKKLGEIHNCRYGFSDHSKELYLTRHIAEQVGCYAWEKHVRFKSITGTPDSKVAITVEEFNTPNFYYSFQHNKNQRVLKDGRWIRP